MTCPECGTALREGATKCPRCGFSFTLRAVLRTVVLLAATGFWLRLASYFRHPASGFEVFGLVLLLLTVTMNLAGIIRGRRAGPLLFGAIGCLNVLCVVGVVFVVYVISAFLKTFH